MNAPCSGDMESTLGMPTVFNPGAVRLPSVTKIIIGNEPPL